MRGKRSLWVALAAVLICMLAVVYWLVDPMAVGWMPRCIWKVATGTDCPGCGSQRMAHALLHGDFTAAWHANAYALCMLPVLGCMLWLEFFRKEHPQLYRKVHAPGVMGVLVASIFGWWILRNLV